MLPPAHRHLRALGAGTVLLAGALVGACNPTPTGPSPTAGPGATAGSGATGAAPTAGSVDREPNVISGRVTTEAGAPVAGASVRIVGYTGGANLGQEIETVVTGADGSYRYEVPRGLYEVLARGPLTFDGQTYLFQLDPVDGSCEQQMSDDGIAKDFVLRLTGLAMCPPGGDPESYYSYHGAVVQLSSGPSTAAPDEIVEYRFEPVGALADGRAVEALTYQRTVAAHSTSAGPVEQTWVLHDIPLGRYVVSAALVAPDGTRVPLLVSTNATPVPAQSTELAFPARSVFGEPEVGYQIPTLSVSEGG